MILTNTTQNDSFQSPTMKLTTTMQVTHSGEVLHLVTSYRGGANDSRKNHGSTIWQKEKKVTFKPIVRVKKVLARRNYTTEEAVCTWYDAEELEHIQQEVNWMLRHQNTREKQKREEGDSEQGAKYGDDDLSVNSTCLKYCPNGLEYQSMKERQAYYEKWKNIYATVLQEQKAQRSEGNHDANLLAQVYVEYSFQSQVKARKIGIRDASIAKSIQFQDDLMMSPIASKKKKNKTVVIVSPLEEFGSTSDCAQRASMLLQRRRKRMSKFACASS